jgi:LmbE family N-acetylglucosaminyl deacetylase
VQEDNHLRPKAVLGVAAHPDDLDYGAGGTMAAFAAQGAKIYYLILTDGGNGSKDHSVQPKTLRDIRRDEQRQAAKILGLTDVFFCDFPDAALENSQDVKREIVRVIRQTKPDVVVTIDPAVLYSARHGFINHPDHRAAGQATLDAVYPLARDHLAFPELLAEGLQPHKAGTVLLFDFTPETLPYNVDITEMLDLKLQALSAHASQFADIETVKNAATERAAEAGKKHGCRYAESFIRIDIR